MAKSPVSILFTTDGVEVGLKDGLALPTDARGFVSIGVDGSGNSRFILTDTSGRQIVVGPAAAGSAVAGAPVLVGGSDGANARYFSVDASGRLNVNVVGTGGASFGSAFPSTGTAVGFYDGTNLQGARVFDADSGAGTQYVLGTILRKSASGGSVEAGTSSDPLRVDPTGTTAQPVTDNGGSLTVDGSVTVTQATASNLNATAAQGAGSGVAGTFWTVRVSDGSSFVTVATDRTTAAAPFAVRLSDGSAFYTAPAATQLPSSLVGGRLDTNIGTWLGSTAPTVGQKTSANSIPIVVASDQSRLPVQSEVQLDFDTGAGTQSLSLMGLALPASGGAVAGGTATNPLRTDPTGTTAQPITDNGGSLTVDGTVTSNQGTAGTHPDRWMIGLSDGSGFISPATDRTTAAAPFSVRLSDGAAFYTAPAAAQLPSSLVGGRLDTNVGSWLGSTAPTVGQKAMASSVPIVIASDQSTVPVSLAGGGAATQVQGTAADGASPVGNPIYIGGFDGAAIQALSVDTQGRLVVAPAGTTASEAGFAAGYIATAATTQVAVRATTYTEQTSNAQRSIVSANAADAAAGTGARTVKITYYTSAGVGPQTETVTLNGTTPVNTVATNICFIEEMEVVTAGSGGVNAGIISLRAATGGGGATIGTIATGDNRTFWAHHYVPSGSSTYVTSVSMGHNGTTVGSGGLYIIRALPIGVANAVETQVSDFIRLYGQSSTVSRNYGTPIRVTGPARIVMYMTPESSTALTFRGAFDFYDQ